MDTMAKLLDLIMKWYAVLTMREIHRHFDQLFPNHHHT